MLKVIKEIMLMLLVCLVGILLFAVLFYEYIPSRKEVSEVTQYSPTSTVSEQLSDSIDSTNENVISTFQYDKDAYQVTSTDLNRFKASKEYVPGKANPFAEVSTEPKGEASESKSGKSSSGSSSKSGGIGGSTEDDENGKSSYIRNKGTK